MLLDFLAGLRPGGRTHLAGCVDRFARAREAAATVVVISDLMDSAAALPDALARLVARGHGVTVLHVYSPADASPPLEGAVILHHAETGERLTVMANEALLAGYRRRFAAFIAGCERACRSRGAAYAAAPSDMPFEHLILHTLRRAGVLAG